VAQFLLDVGVSAMARDQDFTALHLASARGMLDVMDRLIAQGAELEAKNTWGGTVVDSTAWFAVHFPTPGVDYPKVIDRLLAAGADPNEVYPPTTGIAEIDGLLEQYRKS
jgi:hypothetical protein